MEVMVGFCTSVGGMFSAGMHIRRMDGRTQTTFNASFLVQ